MTNLPEERSVSSTFKVEPIEDLVKIIAEADPVLILLVVLPKPTSRYCIDCF